MRFLLCLCTCECAHSNASPQPTFPPSPRGPRRHLRHLQQHVLTPARPRIRVLRGRPRLQNPYPRPARRPCDRPENPRDDPDGGLGEGRPRGRQGGEDPVPWGLAAGTQGVDEAVHALVAVLPYAVVVCSLYQLQKDIIMCGFGNSTLWLWKVLEESILERGYFFLSSLFLVKENDRNARFLGFRDSKLVFGKRNRHERA